VARTLHVSVVTPEGAVLDAEARSVVFPAYDGEIGILPMHAPLLTEVGIGALRVTEPDGGKVTLYVDGGFAQVADDQVTLLTESAMPIEDLEPQRAERAVDQYLHQSLSEEAVLARDRAMERARVQRRLAGKGAS
jgi:F-type H+-transporting ATPase subunit epsilon